jgi:hypothetical protein
VNIPFSGGLQVVLAKAKHPEGGVLTLKHVAVILK